MLIKPSIELDKHFFAIFPILKISLIVFPKAIDGVSNILSSKYFVALSSFSSLLSGTNFIANFTIYLENGNSIATFIKLNSVCAFAICLAASVGSICVTIYVIGLFNINKNKILPITLNNKCIIAALLAFLLAPILDNNEVTQVPMLSP